MKLEVYRHWQSSAIAFVTDFDRSDTLPVVFIAYDIILIHELRIFVVRMELYSSLL